MTIELIKENEIQETCDMVARACKNSVFAEFYPQQPQYFSIPYDEIKQKAEYGHFYVVKECGKIIGCGCIGAYWDSLTESWINTIFVEPSHQHKGIGKKIIEHLESDEYAKRANRIEIHSAISAIPFYRKLGYEHKHGDLSYKDGMFDLEKFFNK
ncbi:GNAT family N-acetyltransferase [Pumilibacter muris]|uniref:GNAT family N-acetyltransferase n=1 Tax=Pumilibacter muris TaxID=2941510 RepID=UPI00203F78B4|nr:GNAT family N-acetyltransferase [Pumilibacter muris]